MFGHADLDLEAVAAEDRTGWSASARSERLLELLELQERVRAEVLRCVGEWDADLAWTADGSKSPAAWIARRAGTTINEARELVRCGRLVQDNATTAKALAAGDISTSHVSTAARAARHVEDLYAEHEDVLVDVARNHPPDDFRMLAARWRDIADDVVGREPAAARFARRRLHISEVLDDMARIDGYLDGEASVRLRLVLDSLEPPDPDDSEATPRTLPQRRADALAKLAAGAEAPRATVHAVVDLDTLEGRMPSDLADARCDLVGHGPVSVATMQRLLCDCSVSRVIMRGKSVVLDLGRSTPVVSEAQRRALAIRDGGCTEPGCTAPPEWCDAHHLVPWTAGGPTDLVNLRLKCRRHHIAAHRHGRGPPLDLAA